VKGGWGGLAPSALYEMIISAKRIGLNLLEKLHAILRQELGEEGEVLLEGGVGGQAALLTKTQQQQVGSHGVLDMDVGAGVGSEQRTDPVVWSEGQLLKSGPSEPVGKQEGTKGSTMATRKGAGTKSLKKKKKKKGAASKKN